MIQNHPLHEKALVVAKDFRRLEVELLVILQEIDRQKIFRQLGYPSLFAYTVGALKLSESQASNFINVARKATEVPELKFAVESGKLSVSKARKIVPVLTKDNQESWIQKAISLPQREVERAVAASQPELAVTERIRPVAEKRSELRCGIDLDLEKKLARIRDLESQRTRGACGIEGALRAMADLYLEKRDPVVRAARVSSARESRVARHAQHIASEMAKPMPSTVRKPIAAKVQHQVVLRDQARCSFMQPDGTRCRTRRWLETHHRVPVSKGGSNALENLLTLCSTHHKLMHETGHALPLPR